MRHVLLVSLICFLTSNVFAQNDSSPKWEIGTDLLWLINKNSLPKYTILFRRSIGEKGAIRVRGGAQRTIAPDNSTGVYPLNYRRLYMVRGGYERRHQLTDKRFFFYYGLEVFYWLDYQDAVDFLAPPLFVAKSTRHRDWGVAALTGFRFQISKNLSVSTESTAQISTSNIMYVLQGEPYEKKFTSYQLIPFNAINLSVHF